jgi:hypothetical protein
LNDEVELPPLEHPTDDARCLGWHALNYRTAHTHALHAQAMYEELERFVREYARAAVLAERARCARIADDMDYGMGELATAIRKGKP